MLPYVLRRIGDAIPTLIGVTVIAFLLVRATPGDPARVAAGMLASPEEVERIRVELGLDRPLLVQYGLYLGDLVKGDLGLSLRTRAPVTEELARRIPATAVLAILAIVLATGLGLLAGVAAASHPRTGWDYTLMSVALFGVSVPVFWLGLMLMLLFSVRLGWFPAGGFQGGLSLVLPSVTLAAFSQAIIARMTRASMLEALAQDYVRTAWAKGAWPGRIHWVHALRNALIPIVTIVGLQLGTLLGGAVLTESTFAWPGVGRLLVDAVAARDYGIIQGVVLFFAVTFIGINLIVDVLYALIDPRIRYD